MFHTKSKEERKLEKPKFKIAERKKHARKAPFRLAVLFLAFFVFAGLIYGLANGYFQISFVKPENRADNLSNQTETLRAELAEMSKQTEIIEKKRDKILEQLRKTKTLLEKSKLSSAEVDAHIEVSSSTCMSCPTPAWVKSYKAVFAAFEETEKILNEDNLDTAAK